MVYPLQHGRRCGVVCLRRRSRCARLQMSLMCHTRRSAASFVLLRTSMSSTNLRCLICRDEYTRRVFLPCSPTDVQRSQDRTTASHVPSLKTQRAGEPSHLAFFLDFPPEPKGRQTLYKATDAPSFLPSRKSGDRFPPSSRARPGLLHQSRQQEVIEKADEDEIR